MTASVMTAAFLVQLQEHLSSSEAMLSIYAPMKEPLQFEECQRVWDHGEVHASHTPSDQALYLCWDKRLSW